MTWPGDHPTKVPAGEAEDPLPLEPLGWVFYGILRLENHFDWEIATRNLGCLWMFMDVYGCLWMFMDVYGCLWMFGMESILESDCPNFGGFCFRTSVNFRCTVLQALLWPESAGATATARSVDQRQCLRMWEIKTTTPKSFTLSSTRLVWKMLLLFDMDYVWIYALCSSLRVSLF